MLVLTDIAFEVCSYGQKDLICCTYYWKDPVIKSSSLISVGNVDTGYMITCSKFGLVKKH